MPVLLKKIKSELEADVAKVGTDSNGNYKYIPPNIVGRKLKDYSRLRSIGIEKVARVGKRDPETGIISFSGLVKSETQSGISYKVSVWFHDMKIKPVESEQFKLKAFVHSTTVAKRKSIFHRVPSAKTNPVTLRCQCQDFRHRFENQLAQEGGLVGGPRKYTRKTPKWPVGYPEVNSTDKLGICKHINSFLLALKDRGEMKN